MKCNDLSYVTFTNIKKMHETLLNSKVSKQIRHQGKTLFCWAFAISTMLRQSLNLFISHIDESSIQKDGALKKLNGVATFSLEKESSDSTSDNSEHQEGNLEIYDIEIDNVSTENDDMERMNQESSDIDCADTDESDDSVKIDKIVDFFRPLLSELSKLEIDSGVKKRAETNSVDEEIDDIDDLQLLLSQMDDTQRHLTERIFSNLFDSDDEDSIETVSTDSFEAENAEKNSTVTDSVSMDFHRQLRNELVMIPIPKSPSHEFNEESPLAQGHYLHMAFERVRNLENLY